MNKVVMVSGCRTVVGPFGGSLKDIPVVDLGAVVLGESLKKSRPANSQRNGFK